MGDDRTPKNDNLNAAPRREVGADDTSEGLMEPPKKDGQSVKTGTPTL